MKLRILILPLFLICTININGQIKDNLKELDSVLTYLHQTKRFNGTVLYAENGQSIYKKAFGVADYATDEKLTSQSSFNLASVSKQFFCVAIGQLADKGLLKLDDDCKKYLPELPYNGITIRNLMNQVSGIPEYFDLFMNHKTPLDTLTNDGLLKLFQQHRPPLDFPTGKQWAYSNTNYVFLASIIERVSKKPIPDYFEKHIFKPLKMENSYVYTIKMPKPANHVLGFSELANGRKLNDLTTFDGVVGDGNIYSSVEDLLTWEQSFYTIKLVSEKYKKEIFKQAKLKNGTSHPYGFGWMIEDEIEQVYLHTGGWAGFGNIIYRDAKKNRTAVVLSSGSNGLANRVLRDFFNGQKLSVPTTFLINNVLLIDGTGLKARNESVRIEGKRIKEVGNLTAFDNEEVIDGQGKILAPGFIDSHSHLQAYLSVYQDAIAALNQGVTTIVSGQDGGSEPIDSILTSLKANPTNVNIATYTGHATIRAKVMGNNNLNRAATKSEIKKIGALLKSEMKKGSLGLSTGLEYEDGFYSSRYEIVELAKIAAVEKGKYISHIRSEDISMVEAIDEIITIGREAKIPVQISHIKIALKDDWGTAPQVLSTLQNARAEGVDITADCYPYDFWNSTPRVLFPKKDFKSLEGAQYATEHLFDADKSIMVRYKPNRVYEGKSVGEIAKLRNETYAQTLLHIIAEAEKFEKENPAAYGIQTIMGKSMSEEDVMSFLAWQHTNVCSDGGNGGHPRGYGSFTKILSRYVKEKQILSWENAINKMTALSAEHVGIKNRGIVAPGYFADLVLIDPDTVKDNAGIDDPKALSDGILKVWVNGILVYKDKATTQKYPGEFIKR